MNRALDLFAQLEEMILSQGNSPLKQEEVDIIVALGEEVSQNAGGITTADLIGWQPEVDALDKIPHLSNHVLAETPTKGKTSETVCKIEEWSSLVLCISFIDSTNIIDGKELKSFQL